MRFQHSKKEIKRLLSFFDQKEGLSPKLYTKMKESSQKGISLAPFYRVWTLCQAFQLKVLNYILFTNSKLFKIGYRTDNVCSFCKREPETIRQFFWDCPYSNLFWKCVESYYFGLRKQLLVHLTLKEIWIGFLTSDRECPLLIISYLGKNIFMKFQKE